MSFGRRFAIYTTVLEGEKKTKRRINESWLFGRSSSW